MDGVKTYIPARHTLSTETLEAAASSECVPVRHDTIYAARTPGPGFDSAGCPNLTHLTDMIRDQHCGSRFHGRPILSAVSPHRCPLG